MNLQEAFNRLKATLSIGHHNKLVVSAQMGGLRPKA